MAKKNEVITTREMRALELNAEYYGVSRLLLMENAGRNVAVEIASRFKPSDGKIAVFCGLGGNGGDGFVAARHLSCLGYEVDVILAGRSRDIVNEEAEKNWHALRSLKSSVSLHEVHDSSLLGKIESRVVVDALLGIGLKSPLKPPILQMVGEINRMEAFKVAVDIPTGIHSDSGEVLGDAVKADMTITFHKAKPGLLKAKDYVGELIVRHIGLPTEVERFAGPGDVSIVRKPRPPESHKGDFGRLLVIGGSEIYSGAPALVALAALRTGVDLVYVAAPQRTAHTISAMSPNLITLKLEGDHLSPRSVAVIRRHITGVTAVVMGPGLGIHKETEDAVDQIIKITEDLKIPLLLDADGLKAFSKFKRRVGTHLVLTPHAGEYRILTGEELSASIEERVKSVQKAAQDLDAVILLKSHVDLISDGERVKLNFTGNPGMTVGGTGDVLSGIVGSLMAQGIDPFEAAAAGAFINGAAGDFVKEEKGYHMVATDLLDWIPKVMDDPMRHLKVSRGAS
ncbi:MAG: NAD(P)H-hydrate dehydratase [Candidatus Bathyarchaeia archaeon]